MESAGRFAVGDTTGALALMRLMWGQMVDPTDPLYTGGLWEFKNSSGGVNRATASLAHGRAASPTVQLTEQVLGVTPVGPGYATWSFKPHTGNLHWAQGSVPTEYCDIGVSWRSSGSGFQMDVHTAGGTSAVPVIAGDVVRVNGHVVWSHGPHGNYHAHMEDGYVVLTTSGGHYTITATRG